MVGLSGLSGFSLLRNSSPLKFVESSLGLEVGMQEMEGNTAAEVLLP